MKLIDELRAQVKSLGPIRRAWFTTFNLGIPFFETHVLPALLSLEKPANRADYEDIQQQIAETDVRIFCDLRAVEADQLKRTAVRIHGLLPFRMDEARFVPDSLFHPKVILLQDASGRMVLGSGSANLTVSGWGRNQEVFTFRPVSTPEQHKQIRRFFDPLVEAASIRDLPPPIKAKFQEGDPTWRFVHSFDREPFLRQLLENADAEQLSIWSPYFARDLSALLTRIRSDFAEGLKFSIVPDRVANKHVRTVKTVQLAEMLERRDLLFHLPPSPRAQEIEITHAKLWLASGSELSRLAIGSWNCTGRGTASFERRNIEAGFIMEVPPSTEIIGQPIEERAVDFCSVEELDREALELLDPPPFELEVVFNWSTSCYQVDGRLFGDAPVSGYQLHLPALAAPTRLVWQSRRRDGAWPLQASTHEVLNDESLLANHCYEVRMGGELVHRGLIQETEQACRRSQGYDSLLDLLNDLIADVKPGASETTRLRKTLRHNDVPEEELPPLQELGQGGTALSYFRVFQGFEKFRRKLREAKSWDEVEKLLFVHAGSLQELAARVEQQVRGTENPVFNWLLVRELRTLYSEAEKRRDKRRVRPAKWSSLRPARSLARLPATIGQNSNYMRQVRELYRSEEK